MCAFSGSTHTYMQHIYVAHLAYPKVMQKKCVRGRRRVEISRESVSSTALELVDRAAGLRLILLIGLWADCCTASLIC